MSHFCEAVGGRVPAPKSRCPWQCYSSETDADETRRTGE